MTSPGRTAVFVKRYRDSAACRTAELNYRWLAGLGSPLRAPQLHWADGVRLGFEPVQGRHASPGDLVPLARHLGAVHAAAHATELHRARLCLPLRTSRGNVIPGFLGRRETAVARELTAGRLPGTTMSISQAAAVLHSACNGPPAFYKDANPRNFIITPDGPVTVDFDDLTLAPFGYDLAKLVVTLAMTYGGTPASQITEAIGAYNVAVYQREHRLGPGVLTWAAFMAWAEIHHILTSRYLGRGGYRHNWCDVRPAAPASRHGAQATHPRRSP